MWIWVLASISTLVSLLFFTIFDVSLLASYSVPCISGLLKISCGKSWHKRQSRDNATFSSLPTACAACTTPATDASSPPGFPLLLGVWCIIMVYNLDIWVQRTGTTQLSHWEMGKWSWLKDFLPRSVFRWICAAGDRANSCAACQQGMDV